MKGVDRFFCNQCEYSGIRARNAQEHCVKQHGEEAKTDYEDRIGVCRFLIKLPSKFS